VVAQDKREAIVAIDANVASAERAP
jgi:putative transposase